MIAKQIVQTTGQIEKMTQFIGQLAAVSLKISACSSLNELSDAMDNASKAMNLVSSKFDNNKLGNMLKNMQKADMKMDMATEMMDDIMEDLNADVDDPEKTDELYNQVLQEAGLSKEELPGVKNESAPEKVQNKPMVLMEGAGPVGGSGGAGGMGGGDAPAGGSGGDDLDALLNSLNQK